MILIHYFISIVVLILFLKRKRFDLLLIGFISLLIYFLPTFYSYTSITKYYYSKINFNTYLLIDTMIVLFYLFVLVNDFFIKRKSVKVAFNFNTNDKYTFKLINLVIYSVFVVVILDLGISNLVQTKSFINSNINSLGYSFVIWSSLVVYTFGLKTRKRLYLVYSVVIILFSVFIGSRAILATAFVITLVIKWSESKRFIKDNRLGVISATVFALIVLVYKELYKYVKAGDFKSVFEAISNIGTYKSVLEFPESFITFSLLNYTIDNNFRLGNEHLNGILISIIPGLNNMYDTSMLRMSSIYKNIIFDTHFGLANSIWGESYAIGGFWGVYVFFIIWLLFLAISNWLIGKSTIAIVFIIPLATNLSFYIHRLDFVQVIGVFKNIILVSIIYVLVRIIVVILPKNKVISDKTIIYHKNL